MVGGVRRLGRSACHVGARRGRDEITIAVATRLVRPCCWRACPESPQPLPRLRPPFPSWASRSTTFGLDGSTSPNHCSPCGLQLLAVPSVWVHSEPTTRHTRGARLRFGVDEMWARPDGAFTRRINKRIVANDTTRLM